RGGADRVLQGHDRELQGAALCALRRRVADVGHEDQEVPAARGSVARAGVGGDRLISTPLSERIGIEIPLMQAGMGGIGQMTLARLAAAIPNAGALGTLAQPALVLEEIGGDPDEVAEQVAQVVQQVRDGIRLAVSLTDRPLAINVRIAQEQPDAEAVIRAILEEREREPEVRAD